MGKPAPRYWWDFSQPGESPIIVQSDQPGGERLAEFPFEGYADAAIAQAEQLISDYRAGRKTPSKCASPAQPAPMHKTHAPKNRRPTAPASGL